MQRHIESLDKPRLAAEAFGGFQFLNRAYAPVHAWLEQRAQLSLDEQVRKILVPEGIEAPPIEVSISLIKHETAADAAALRNDVRSSEPTRRRKRVIRKTLHNISFAKLYR